LGSTVSMANINKLDQVAREKLRRYEQHQLMLLIANTVGYISLALLSVVLVMLVSGPVFNPILNLIGLESIWNDESGVYADCSSIDNRSNRFCSGKYPEKEAQWNTLAKSSGGKAVPFNLYGQ